MDGANSIEYDTAGETTTFAYEIGGEANARSLGFTGGGDGSIKVEFVAEGFDSKEIAISGDRQALGGLDVPTALGLPALPHGASISMGATGGVEQTFKMTVPVTPENARLIQSMMLGGSDDALAALPGLVDGSQVVIQANAVAKAKGGSTSSWSKARPVWRRAATSARGPSSPVRAGAATDPDLRPAVR